MRSRELLAFRDGAVRRGASQRIKDDSNDAAAAADHLLAAAEAPSCPVRYSLARAVADGRPSKPVGDLKSIVKVIADGDPEARSTIGQVAFLADQLDCRWAEPFIAVTLFDSDARVRRSAAGALYMLFDMSPNQAERISIPSLARAVETERESDVAQELQAALKAGT